MIDISKELVIHLNAAADMVPCRRAGRKCHIATIYRWAQRGVRGVRLETIQVGGTRCTSREALQRFFNALGNQAAAPTVSPSDSAIASLAAANRELDKAGI